MQDNQSIRNHILDLRKLSNMAILKKDTAGAARFWMDDILVVSGEGTSYTGKKLLESVWVKMFAVRQPPVFERLPAEVVIGESGILAWETGTWNYKNEKFRGNYSAMWRKVDGHWLTQAELFVSLD
jgi:ketosteroid isomerase-like protein